ncbi:ATP-binding protein [Reichenbachiella ulvae]|uniref:ATP-binding protein n=1 Tax=Reichenbachiella ulvae TaxID=2980104 RepID=A0ABT3CTK8_9BACT|nr:ATP-binding protein [Reichenbachiella ulvae]MCV9386859.1 ATP-binding protein [Reichenbachiella ulvae]
MHHNLIFIGGIHGVGKGTICSKIANELNLKHLSASEVLKWSEVSPDTSNKFVKDIADTQDRLISGLEKLIKPDVKYLLDGHFCLFDSNGIPQKVSINTFQRIAPIVLAVVKADIGMVANRLKKRDGKDYNQTLLNEMQGIEKSHAIAVAKELNVPFFEINNESIGELIKFLSN